MKSVLGGDAAQPSVPQPEGYDVAVPAPETQQTGYGAALSTAGSGNYPVELYRGFQGGAQDEAPAILRPVGELVPGLDGKQQAGVPSWDARLPRNVVDEYWAQYARGF